jgi:hypothetical protein
VAGNQDNPTLLFDLTSNKNQNLTSNQNMPSCIFSSPCRMILANIPKNASWIVWKWNKNSWGMQTKA